MYHRTIKSGASRSTGASDDAQDRSGVSFVMRTIGHAPGTREHMKRAHLTKGGKNDAEVEEGLGLETDTAFAGHSGGNAADNDAEVDSTVGEQADDFFGGDADRKAARSDSASAPRDYLAGMDYKAPNYLQGSGW